MANYVKIFGARVSEARKARKWTQKRLADESGLTQGMISIIEGGKGEDITMGTVKALADAFDETSAALLGDEPLAAQVIQRDPTEEELALDIIQRFDIDSKRRAICLLALTATPGDIEYMYNTILAPYLEGIEGGATNNKKPSAG